MQDIRPGWLNVARRLQSVACRQEGAAIILLKIVVNASGEPAFWVEPECLKLEPRSSANEIIDMLTDKHDLNKE